MPVGGGGGSRQEYRLATMAILEEDTLEVHSDIVAGEVYVPDVWKMSIWFEWEIVTGDVLYDSMMSSGGGGSVAKYGIAWLKGLQQLHNAIWFVGK